MKPTPSIALKRFGRVALAVAICIGTGLGCIDTARQALAADDPVGEQPRPARKARPKKGDDEAPFGAAQEAPPKRADKPADKAAGRPAKSGKAAAPAAVVPDSAAVRTIRESNPEKPAELVRAIDMLVPLDALPLAQQYLKKLLDQQLSPAQMVALGEEVGLEPLVRMASAQELGPEAQRFANAVLAALHESQVDPQRIARLIEGLRSGSEPDRMAARADLRNAGRAAIAPLVRVLADPAQKAVHAEARSALLGLGSEAVEPLLAVFNSSPPPLQAEVAALLLRLVEPSALGARASESRAVEALLPASVAPGTSPQVQRLASRLVERSLGAAPDRADVARRLETAAADYLRGDRQLPSDTNGQTTVWQWDPARGTLTQTPLPAGLASARYAGWLARRAHDVLPESRQAAQLSMLATLQSAKLQGGIERPLHGGPYEASYNRAASLGVDGVERILARAVSENYIPAAMAAVEVLGNSGDVGQLTRGGATPCPLVRAAEHPDRRLRLAALSAIAQLHPTQPFAGSSVVPKGLEFLARYSFQPRGVVADPRAERAHELASLLEQVGLTASISQTGRELIQAAVATPENEVAIVVFTLERPAADEAIRQLRRDPRTARLPIGLIANPDDLLKAEAMVAHDPLTMVFVRPRDVATMRERVTALEALPGADAVPRPERLAQSLTALTLIQQLATSSPGLFDFSGAERAAETAVYVPELSQGALKILARAKSAQAQDFLADLASSTPQPIALRQGAAAAFAENLKHNGLRLSIAQIQEQSRRYDQSESLDQATQDVLWSVLDSIQRIRKQPGEDGRKSEVGRRK